jgi:hypothetical protein
LRFWWGRWDLNLAPQARCKSAKSIIATFAFSPQLSSLFLFSLEAGLLGDEKYERKNCELSSLRKESFIGTLRMDSSRAGEMSNLREYPNNTRLQEVHANGNYSALFLQRVCDEILIASNLYQIFISLFLKLKNPSLLRSDIF